MPKDEKITLERQRDKFGYTSADQVKPTPKTEEETKSIEQFVADYEKSVKEE